MKSYGHEKLVVNIYVRIGLFTGFSALSSAFTAILNDDLQNPSYSGEKIFPGLYDTIFFQKRNASFLKADRVI